MTFYKYVRRYFGNIIVKNMKAFSSLKRNLALQLNRRIFLLECKRLKLQPNFLKRGLKNLYNCIQCINDHTLKRLNEIHSKVTQKLLRLEIDNCHAKINNIKFELQHIQNYILNSNLSNEILYMYFKSQSIRFTKIFDAIKFKNLNKIAVLKQTHSNKQFKPNENWLVNKSNKFIPDNIKHFLSMGSKFALKTTLNDINISKLLAEVESILTEFPPDKIDEIRSKAINIITNYIHKNKSKKTNIDKDELDTRLFLKSNPDILITKADKGNVTVILDKNDYITKSLELLNDETTYHIINKDTTLTIEREHNKILNELENSNCISKEESKLYKIYNSTIPLFYGLPKIHKPFCPLRPIISSIYSPLRGLCTLFSNILNNSFKDFNKYKLKDSFQFLEKIKDIQIPCNHIIISLDVVSLFTNISKPLFLSIIEKNWQLISSNTHIKITRFKSIISFIFDNNIFKFQNVYYKQILGTPMGSIISPVIADIIMNDLINYSLSKLPFSLPFIFHYVDDIICSIPEDKINLVLDIFNSYHPNLKFTVETEQNFSIPFLDINVIRENNKIITDWYKKPTSSSRYIPFHSQHPFFQKINLILALKHRIISLSHKKFHLKNLNILKSILKENNYPDHLLNKFLNSSYKSKQKFRNTNNNFNIKYKKLLHIKDLTPKLLKLLKLDNIVISNYCSNTFEKYYSKLKDKISQSDYSNIIYSLKCLDCNQNYIGQSSQKLKFRLAQHISDIKCKPNACALTKHISNTLHSVDFKNPKILTYEKDKLKRTFLEMCYIKKYDKNNLNYNSDIHNLNSMYSYLLKQNYTSF